MDRPKIRGSLFRIGGLLGAAITAVRWLLALYGELDTGTSAFDNRGPIVDLIGAVVASSWFGPVVAGCLATGMRYGLHVG